MSFVGIQVKAANLPFIVVTEWFCITEMDSVYCAVRSEFLFKTNYFKVFLTLNFYPLSPSCPHSYIFTLYPVLQFCQHSMCFGFSGVKWSLQFSLLNVK
jgi:hypothetical protein